MLDPWGPTDPLGSALHLLRMNGAFYCRTELSAPWGLTMPAMPGYLWFHVVLSGTLRLETPDGTEHHRVAVAGSPAEAEPQADDVVLLTVKSQDTDAALDQLRAAAPPEVAVVCAQNGVDNEPRALRRFRHVYGMCVVLPAAFTEPGVVYQFSGPQAGALDLGCYPSGVDDRAERIAADLRAASFGSVADPDVMRAKHRKLLMNLGNALDALCGWESRGSELYRRAIAEGQACLAAAGIDVQTPEEEAERREGVRMLPAGGVTHSGSSTTQSLERGTGSVETEALLQTAWFEKPTLPQTLETSALMSEPMAAFGPTYWLFCTVVLFIVMMSTRLPAAAPWKAASPPTESTTVFRFDHWVCRVTWPLMMFELPPDVSDQPELSQLP